jgi:type II secretory pathway component PulJ
MLLGILSSELQVPTASQWSRFDSRRSALTPDPWRLAPRFGFTVVEVTIVSGFLAVFAVLLAQAWTGLGRPLVSTAARCRVAQEADAAVACLERDLCGYLADNSGRLGKKVLYRFVGRMQPQNSQLWLCFDGGNNPNGVADWGAPDTVIVYQVVGGNLLRTDQTSGTSHTVARYVQQMQAYDLGGSVQIVLTISYRGITQNYNLIAKDP